MSFMLYLIECDGSDQYEFYEDVLIQWVDVDYSQIVIENGKYYYIECGVGDGVCIIKKVGFVNDDCSDYLKCQGGIIGGG